MQKLTTFPVSICHFVPVESAQYPKGERPLQSLEHAACSLLPHGGGKQWAIQVERGSAAKFDWGVHEACDDLGPGCCLVVYSGNERYRRTERIEMISLSDMMRNIEAA